MLPAKFPPGGSAAGGAEAEPSRVLSLRAQLRYLREQARDLGSEETRTAIDLAINALDHEYAEIVARARGPFPFE